MLAGPRRRLGRRRWRRPSPRTACRSRPPTRSTSSTPRARPGKPKGVVRDNGGHAVALAWTHAQRLRHRARATCAGPPPTSAGSSATPTSSTRRCWPAATTVLYEGKPVGTPDAGRVLAGDRRARGEGAVHRADRDPGDQEGGPGRRTCSPATTCRRCGTCSWPASGSTRRPTTGPRDLLGHPGHRPLVADRDRLADRRQPAGLEPMPIKPGSPTVPVPGYDVRILDATAQARRPGTRATSSSGCRCRPARCPRCGATTSAIVDSYLSAFRGLLPDRRRRLHRRRRLPLRHGPHRRRHQRGRAPAVHRRDGGGARRHPAVAECAVIGVADALKGQVPRGFVVLKAGVEARPGAAARRARRSWCATRSAPVAALKVDVVRRAAQDPLGQDPAQDHARHRRRPRRAGAVDHRRPGRAGRAQAAPPRWLMGGGGDGSEGLCHQPASPGAPAGYAVMRVGDQRDRPVDVRGRLRLTRARRCPKPARAEGFFRLPSALPGAFSGPERAVSHSIHCGHHDPWFSAAPASHWSGSSAGRRPLPIVITALSRPG